VISLGIALIIAAVLLGPWRLRFAIDAHDLYEDLRRGITPGVTTPGAAAETPEASAAAGFSTSSYSVITSGVCAECPGCWASLPRSWSAQRWHG
jgi:hypothetical protein